MGYLLLFMGVISGLYGVMLAILQHNLKKLLAYHSIENIGIIGIGIGLGIDRYRHEQPHADHSGLRGGDAACA